MEKDRNDVADFVNLEIDDSVLAYFAHLAGLVRLAPRNREDFGTDAEDVCISICAVSPHALAVRGGETAIAKPTAASLQERVSALSFGG